MSDQNFLIFVFWYIRVAWFACWKCADFGLTYFVLYRNCCARLGSFQTLSLGLVQTIWSLFLFSSNAMFLFCYPIFTINLRLIFPKILNELNLMCHLTELMVGFGINTGKLKKMYQVNRFTIFFIQFYSFFVFLILG